jgi:cutinase
MSQIASLRRHIGMEITRLRGVIGALFTIVATVSLTVVITPVADAQPCPDVEVIFARGTTEPPGVGGIGQAFVDSLRARLGERSVGVYAVDYPASRDFARSTPAGRDDVSAHALATAAECPATRMVLGGYSQGAAVVDLATSVMPPEVANHVAAAALFGGPRSTFADSLSPGPLPSIGPLYVAKTIELCVSNDPICFQGGTDMRAHSAYVDAGMVEQAADFAAGRL